MSVQLKFTGFETCLKVQAVSIVTSIPAIEVIAGKVSASSTDGVPAASEKWKTQWNPRASGFKTNIFYGYLG